jgi:hypothetical protein
VISIRINQLPVSAASFCCQFLLPVSAASFCCQVVASIPHMFRNLYSVKNHKIANNSTANEAKVAQFSNPHNFRKK